MVILAKGDRPVPRTMGGLYVTPSPLRERAGVRVKALLLQGKVPRFRLFARMTGHAGVSECGNPITHSAISAPSAVNASNLTGKNAKPTMNESHERSPADAPSPAKPCETNREKRRGKFDRGEVFSNCLTTRHLSDAYARYSFKTPGRTGRNERDKLRTGGKRERSGRVPNCLIVSDCLTPYSDPSFPRRRESRILPRDLRALCGESRCRNAGAGIHPFQPATIWRHNGNDGA